MASWQLLDERSEAELHKSRLLNVEEKPFKRITKRLTSVSSSVSDILHTQQNTPRRNGEDAANTTSPESLSEELTLDFAAFDSSIVRLQFLHSANQRERERYAADQERILAECQAVRTNNAQLKGQLDAAQATLAQRKKFDELAERITSNRLLRPREDQLTNLAKLDDECKELERESGTYKETWKERREQFNRIMEEGMLLRRQIRDEKEEVDRREGMNEEEEEAEGERDGTTPKPLPSGNATPRPDGESQPRPGAGRDNEEGTASATAFATPAEGTPVPERAPRSAPTPTESVTSTAAHASAQHLQVPGASTPSHQQAQTAEDVEMRDQGGSNAAAQEDHENEERMEVD